MIGLSQRRVCQILAIARSRLFYVKQPTSEDQVEMMNALLSTAKLYEPLR